MVLSLRSFFVLFLSVWMVACPLSASAAPDWDALLNKAENSDWKGSSSGRGSQVLAPRSPRQDTGGGALDAAVYGQQQATPFSSPRPISPTALESDYRRRMGEGFSSNDPLSQFGYGSLKTDGFLPENDQFPQGTVGDSYVLGIGDTLAITLRGSKASSEDVTVNRDGTVIIASLPPVRAAGRSLGEFRAALQEEVDLGFGKTETFVSLGRIRQINVMVMGNVPSPGLKSLTSYATVLDALISAGGVEKTGSLRAVKLLRSDETRTVDLYDLLIGATSSTDFRLEDGDRLMVPPLGATVAVAGDVQQSAIYELPEGKTVVYLHELFRYAGQPLRAKGSRLLRYRLDHKGSDHIEEVSGNRDIQLSANDILFVRRGDQRKQDVVFLEGNVYSPGKRPLATARTVRELVGSLNNLIANPYLPFAVLIRQSADTGASSYLPLNLATILSGKEDKPLQNLDRLVVFSYSDIAYLWSADVYALLSQKIPASLDLAVSDQFPTFNRTTDPKKQLTPLAGAAVQETVPTGVMPSQVDVVSENAAAALASGPQDDEKNKGRKQRSSLIARDYQGLKIIENENCAGLQSLTHAMRSATNARFTSAFRALTLLKQQGSNLQDLEIYRSCPAVFETEGALLPLLLDHVVAVVGEVQQPGAYPVAGTLSLSNLIGAAGGLTPNADTDNSTLSQFRYDTQKDTVTVNRLAVSLHPQSGVLPVRAGDFLVVQRHTSESSQGVVEVMGQVRRPGVYEVRRNERLFSLIERAGGLNEEAYPYGAIFTRESVKAVEKESYLRVASQLEVGLLSNIGRIQGDNTNVSAVVSAANTLVGDLRNATPVGRMVVEADPTVLAAKPQLDVILEPGDRLFFPKRPYYVMVSGEVLNPGAQQFVPELRPEDYIKAAGGLQQTADDDRVFALLPNGQAEPLSLSSWNYTASRIPPGTTIIIPTNPVPFDTFTLVKEVGGVVSQLAISAASLAVINRN